MIYTKCEILLFSNLKQECSHVFFLKLIFRIYERLEILFPIMYVLFPVVIITVQIVYMFKYCSMGNTYIYDLLSLPIILYSTGILIEQCHNILSWTFFVEYVTQLVKGCINLRNLLSDKVHGFSIATHTQKNVFFTPYLLYAWVVTRVTWTITTQKHIGDH